MDQTIVHPERKRDVLSGILNKQVANFNVLYVKLHHYHWYVKGPHFFELHAKFEELYNEMTAHMDEVAERLLTIGGSPLSTMKEYLQESSLQEAVGNESAEQMVQAVHDDLTTVVHELMAGVAEAEKQEDQTTADMLLAIHTSLEKHVWMLRSFLGK